ncbi:uncharacterized protein LOC121876485 [Homarus americanus]|uniref:Unhealthy ribosome biogenesis protein 2-like n=1 Tax=Homarus americanus TaxID=6706 RepID=A0A8J5JL05_HOMAM|nr:uncharacterized protein LOC121876485 [Homarus americanus]KAG7160257.1 Unhealthy ribosome biogenesis protein 2-like [Homarus americanus]
MASAGGLKARLYSSEPLQERLSLGERAFLAPLNVLVTQKEDVVIMWLSELLANKALTLNTEDLEAAWRTVDTLLNTRRLKALCNNSWLCPISSNFIEALVDIINSSSEDSVREAAVKVCHTMMSNLVLAPLITHSHDHCIFLIKGLVNWLLEGHKSDFDVTLTMKMTQEIGTHLQSQPNRVQALVSVVDHLLIPCARLNAAFQDDKREIVQNLLKEVKLVVSMNLFNHELFSVYNGSLHTLFFEETKATLSTDVEKLLLSIRSAVEDEEVQVSQFLLAEFLTEFSIRMKNKHILHYEMLIVLCHMLDVSFPDFKMPSIEKNSLAAQNLKPTKLDKGKQEALLFSILRAVESCSWDFATKVKHVSLSIWLDSLGDMLAKSMPATVQGYKCLHILLIMLPQEMSNHIFKNLMNIYRYTKVSDMAPGMDALYSAYDDLLCETLEVCVKLRNLPKMLSRILIGLKEHKSSLENQKIIPESLLVYEGKLLLPPRFMLSLVRVIGTLGHTQVLPVWKSLLSFFTKECAAISKSPVKPGDLQLVSVVVWLFSCIMKASPTIQAVSVVGVAQNYADIMTQIAVYGITPLVTAMLTQPHNNNVCGSILILCHTWGELHTNLLTTDTGYSEGPDLPKVHPPKPSTATDCSYLLPFISPEAWAQISARVANFGDQPTQLALVQLVIQKFSQVALEHHRNYLCLDVSCDQANQTPTRQTIEVQTKYLMNALDIWGSNVSQLMTVHLVYLLPFIHNSHLPAIARHLVCGIREGKKVWQEYVDSQQFCEASRLHPHIFSSICSTLITLSGSCKRKISESEDTPATNKNYYTELLKKMIKIGPLLSEFDTGLFEENALWEMLKKCGNTLKKLIKNSDASNGSVGNTTDLCAMINLLGKFPLPHLYTGFQTALLLVFFALVTRKDLENTEENFSSLLHVINKVLCSKRSFRLFRIIDASCFLQWLVQKRLSFPFSSVSQHMANLSQTVLKKKICPRDQSSDKPEDSLTVQALTGQHFDQLLSALLYKLTAGGKNADDIKDLTNYITTSFVVDTDAELLLQPAVLLMAACYRMESFSCKWAMRHLSSWVLRHLKKMDLATIAPSTAAAILTAHTITVLTYSKDNSKTVESTNKENKETTTEDTGEEHKKDQESLELEEQTHKTPRWQKLLGLSFQLSELCLSSGHPELEEYALTFLVTVSLHSNSLQSHLPAHILSTAWTALSHPGRLPIGNDSLLHNNISLDSLLSSAPSDEYEKLLQDLLKRTLSDNADLTHTLTLWQLVIAAKVFEVHGAQKRMALEHLIPILVNLITVYDNSEECVSPYLIPILETLRQLTICPLQFEAQSRAFVLTPCTTIHLHTLPIDQFNQAFTAATGIVNSIVVQHIGVAMERVTSVLAAISHLATSLIAQASQERKLEEDQIEIMVGCGTNLERVVRELTPYSYKLNKVVHFTVATIVGALQLTTVYPAVKTILESIVYHLLDMCDRHCLNHLMVALPPATTTILKHLYTNYSTFHRFNPIH